MKLFLKNLAVFLLIALVLIQVKAFYLYSTGKYQQTVEAAYIYNAILKSKKQTKIKKLIMGDSVIRQLYPNNIKSDQYYSLVCNRAISIVGQYLLLNNLINAGNTIDTLFLSFTPGTFREDLNGKHTFHYFLKPFNRKEYKPEFTEEVYHNLGKVPLHYLSQYPFILASDWSPKYNPKPNTAFSFISPIARQYLSKIKELSIKNNFKIVFIPPPTSERYADEIKTFNFDELIGTGFEMDLKNYFNEIPILPDSCFLDGIHLHKPNLYKKYFINYINL